MTINKIIYSILLLGCFTMQAQVKVGTSPTIINSSALFEMESVQKGFLPPRMTTAQQAAIASPAKGLVLYNTTLDCLQINKGTPASPNWECIGASAAPTLVADCNASRFALSSPAQDPLCIGLFTGTSGYQVKFVLTNNSLSAVSGLDLSTAVSLTGAGAAGLTVTAGQNTNVSVNSAASVTLTYNFTGSPTTAGSLTATFSRLGLTCTITNTVANPATWVGNGLDGTTSPNANYSCLAIKNAFPASADGAYWVDPDGSCTAFNAMQAQCDMTTDGGGWTLVKNYNHGAGTNPALNDSRSTFPLIASTVAVAAGEASNSTAWGGVPSSLITSIATNGYLVEGWNTSARQVAFKFNTNLSFNSSIVNTTGWGTGNVQNLNINNNSGVWFNYSAGNCNDPKFNVGAIWCSANNLWAYFITPPSNCGGCSGTEQNNTFVGRIWVR